MTEIKKLKTFIGCGSRIKCGTLEGNVMEVNEYEETCNVDFKGKEPTSFNEECENLPLQCIEKIGINFKHGDRAILEVEVIIIAEDEGGDVGVQIADVENPLDYRFVVPNISLRRKYKHDPMWGRS